MNKRPTAIARNFFAVLFGLAGAVLVVTIGSFVVFRNSFSAEDLARIKGATRASADFERAMTQISDPFVRIQRVTATSTFIIFPIAAVIAGLIVGGIASTHSAVLSASTGLLSAGVLLAGIGFSIRSFILGAVYATLAGLSGSQSARWRAGRWP